MQLNPYLSFNGRGAEAFAFYEKVFGGQAQCMTFGQMPPGEGPGCDALPPGWADKIMHGQLPVGQGVMMGSDGMPGQPGQPTQAPQEVALAVSADSSAEAERIFAALSEGGKVTMPMAETFWAHRFGALTDKYGFDWLVNHLKTPPAG
jgi:PhnB protein